MVKDFIIDENNTELDLKKGCWIVQKRGVFYNPTLLQIAKSCPWIKIL